MCSTALLPRSTHQAKRAQSYIDAHANARAHAHVRTHAPCTRKHTPFSNLEREAMSKREVFHFHSLYILNFRHSDIQISPRINPRTIHIFWTTLKSQHFCQPKQGLLLFAKDVSIHYLFFPLIILDFLSWGLLSLMLVFLVIFVRWPRRAQMQAVNPRFEALGSSLSAFALLVRWEWIAFFQCLCAPSAILVDRKRTKIRNKKRQRTRLDSTQFVCAVFTPA